MTCEDEAVDASIAPVDVLEPDSIPNGCYGGGLTVICPDDPITGQDNINVLTTQSIDTTNSALCEPYHLLTGPDASLCVIAAKSITITVVGRWNVTGTRPLVVIGSMSIDVNGTIDVASHRNGTTGPGADSSKCASGTSPLNDQGGPGGSFGTTGGNGGGVDVGLPVPAGLPTTKPVTTLRGGCPGLRGSGGNANGSGSGGGAVYLIADSISIGGTINASGASGNGAGLSAGGSGGGSGGMIALDAPTIQTTAAARIFANGGGGGEGGGGSNGGNDGNDPTGPAIVPAGGQNNAGGGGDGGDGAFGATAAETGENGADSGGGGGGGAGVIRVFPSRMLGGSISPPAT